ncbi:hypothetical protein JCM17846_06520 [Iodidimonas nitroreducens]|uniref:Uncharacterized protein n=1 Tax=Iodidimonas nitroreducens TaxID=1236968 RepID=A0A5A7N6D4_9PROT|nr:hypothetical protein JCM17846_06520 [Iodidimonas nitroreducens]
MWCGGGFFHHSRTANIGRRPSPDGPAVSSVPQWDEAHSYKKNQGNLRMDKFVSYEKAQTFCFILAESVIFRKKNKAAFLYKA